MSTTRLDQYNNSWYQPGPKLKILLWYFVNALFLRNSYLPFSSLKVFFLRQFGAKIGRGVVIKPGVSVKYPWKLTIGDHCWIGENVWIDNLAEVKIGSQVCLSQASMLLTGNHNYKKTTFDLIVSPITLEDGVWIGAKAMVCPGVYCNSHSILSVQSVANKDLEAYTIYQGNPAQKLRIRNIT